MSNPLSKQAVLEELTRLRAKKSASDDRDIRQALQLRIDSLEADAARLEAEAVAKPKPEEAAEEDGERPAPTPAQLRQADELVRQARVEKMRKNNARALTLMKEAADIAPTSSTVLEALGDDQTERRLYKDAVESYSKAMKYAKHNIELERKHGTAVLRAKGMSSFDASMTWMNSDPLFLTSSTSMASVGWARTLNAFFPGVGHLVVGKTVGGLCLIAAMIGWVVWLFLMHEDVAGLVTMFGKSGHQPNLIVLVPLFGIFVTYIIGLTSLGGQTALKQNRAVARPQPPVNLPFE